MLFISHDLGVVGEIAQQIVVMRQGTVRERGTVGELFGAPEGRLHARRCSPAARAWTSARAGSR